MDPYSIYQSDEIKIINWVNFEVELRDQIRLLTFVWDAVPCVLSASERDFNKLDMVVFNTRFYQKKLIFPNSETLGFPLTGIQFGNQKIFFQPQEANEQGPLKLIHDPSLSQFMDEIPWMGPALILEKLDLSDF